MPKRLPRWLLVVALVWAVGSSTAQALHAIRHGSSPTTAASEGFCPVCLVATQGIPPPSAPSALLAPASVPMPPVRHVHPARQAFAFRPWRPAAPRAPPHPPGT